jgi:hypothetical protein
MFTSVYLTSITPSNNAFSRAGPSEVKAGTCPCPPPPSLAAAPRSSVRLWEPVRYKELFEVGGMIVCVLLTTSAVEADFSRLIGAKTDYRINLSCLALEGVMQASKLMVIAGKFNV